MWDAADSAVSFVSRGARRFLRFGLSKKATFRRVIELVLRPIHVKGPSHGLECVGPTNPIRMAVLAVATGLDSVNYVKIAHFTR